jgi:asparaginyl-tRNA synthetase
MKHIDIKEIIKNQEYIGKNVTVCGWIKCVRNSKKMCFIELNDGTSLKNIQLVIDKENNSEDLLNELKVGASIAVQGMVVNSVNDNQKIEINTENIKIIGKCPNDYPIQKKKQNLETLREIPHLRPRTNTFNALFRLRSVLSKAIHDYFQENDYVYVNPPIITSSACEGAGDLFRLTTLDIDSISRNKYNPNTSKDDFFGTKVYLSVSGQLEAEAMISGLNRVYTFAPSFRADSSNTKKHLSEFWIIEPEVAFADINEIKDEVKKLYKYVIKRVLKECPDEIAFFTKFYDNNLTDKLLSSLETDFVDLDYNDAIKILKESMNKFQYPVEWGTNLKTEHLKFITEEVFEKPVFINNSPKDLKPFYIKLNDDEKTVASSDLYFPKIGDIFGASEKEADYDKLLNRIKELGMSYDDYKWYLELRKYGTVPHSGFGLGLERLLMYTSGIENIRDTIPFPRTKCKNL